MRQTMHTGVTANQEAAPDDALALSALDTARAAIARWSGRALPATLAPDTVRVSPQARWVAETQRGLTAFFDNGGFAQFDAGADPLPALLTPTMFSLHQVKACTD